MLVGSASACGAAKHGNVGTDGCSRVDPLVAITMLPGHRRLKLRAWTQAHAPLPTAQTLAEKEAWRLAKELDLELVTICPTYVVGPLISGRASTSVKFFVVRMLPVPFGVGLLLGFDRIRVGLEFGSGSGLGLGLGSGSRLGVGAGSQPVASALATPLVCSFSGPHPC